MLRRGLTPESFFLARFRFIQMTSSSRRDSAAARLGAKALVWLADSRESVSNHDHSASSSWRRPNKPRD